jgi:hypothetical protein
MTANTTTQGYATQGAANKGKTKGPIDRFFSDIKAVFKAIWHSPWGCGSGWGKLFTFLTAGISLIIGAIGIKLSGNYSHDAPVDEGIADNGVYSPHAQKKKIESEVDEGLDMPVFTGVLERENKGTSIQDVKAGLAQRARAFTTSSQAIQTDHEVPSDYPDDSALAQAKALEALRLTIRSLESQLADQVGVSIKTDNQLQSEFKLETSDGSTQTEASEAIADVCVASQASILAAADTAVKDVSNAGSQTHVVSMASAGSQADNLPLEGGEWLASSEDERDRVAQLEARLVQLALDLEAKTSGMDDQQRKLDTLETEKQAMVDMFARMGSLLDGEKFGHKLSTEEDLLLFVEQLVDLQLASASEQAQGEDEDDVAVLQAQRDQLARDYALLQERLNEMTADLNASFEHAESQEEYLNSCDQNYNQAKDVLALEYQGKIDALHAANEALIRERDGQATVHNEVLADQAQSTARLIELQNSFDLIDHKNADLTQRLELSVEQLSAKDEAIAALTTEKEALATTNTRLAVTTIDELPTECEAVYASHAGVLSAVGEIANGRSNGAAASTPIDRATFKAVVGLLKGDDSAKLTLSKGFNTYFERNDNLTVGGQQYTKQQIASAMQLYQPKAYGNIRISLDASKGSVASPMSQANTSLSAANTSRPRSATFSGTPTPNFRDGSFILDDDMRAVSDATKSSVSW